MCRHIAYLGPSVPLGELLVSPAHGLVRQSWEPRRQRNGTVNADLQKKLIDPLPQPMRRNVGLWRIEHLTVHAKIVIVDDCFAAVGSANFFSRSMVGVDTELTAALVTAGDAVRDLRVRTVVAGRTVRVWLDPARRGARILLEYRSREHFGWWPLARRRTDAHGRARFRVAGRADQHVRALVVAAAVHRWATVGWRHADGRSVRLLARHTAAAARRQHCQPSRRARGADHVRRCQRPTDRDARARDPRTCWTGAWPARQRRARSA